jgi:multiple sugar transport system permease protein
VFQPFVEPDHDRADRAADRHHVPGQAAAEDAARDRGHQGGLPFGVFLMRQFYMSIPDELCEAARIDGMSEYGIWRRIMLPLSMPALSTLTIFTFVTTWNDFLGPLIYLTKTELKTVQVGIRMFITQYSAEYGLIMAASVVSLIPVLIVFLALQRFFVEGIASTGMKG